MSEILKKAKLHLRDAEKFLDLGNQTPVIPNLRWSVAYALVATAEGVWELVELLRRVHPDAAHRVATNREQPETVTDRVAHDHPFSEQIARDVR